MKKKISIKKIFYKTIQAYKNNKIFILFKKKNEKYLYLYIHNNNNKNINNEKFIIGNINNKKKIHIQPKNIYLSKIKYYNKYILHINKIKINRKPSKNYMNNIQKALYLLKNNKLKKVIIFKKTKIKNHINIIQTFKNLIKKYPNNFNNLWFTPKYGLWIGSTPEKLFHIQKNILITEALAGTVLKNNIWTTKELQEHYIVLNYIKKILKNKYFGKIQVKSSKSYYNNIIKHLKTKIIFFFKTQPNIKKLISNLHPTPSVCGLPKKKALEFIQKEEKNNRNFYTGYLANIKKNTTDVYVNIRCLQILNNTTNIYSGCGITNKSNIKKEWLESELKAQNIIQNIIFK